MTVAVSSAEFGVMKPDPRIFQEALDQMQVSAVDAVMVGDSLPHDVLGARQLGMRGVWLDRDGRREQATHLDATIPVIVSLRELPDLLTRTSE
jgi:putative hydrolase of the HAD superfamily